MDFRLGGSGQFDDYGGQTEEWERMPVVEKYAFLGFTNNGQDT